MLEKGISDSNCVKWWRAIAMGFMGVGSPSGKSRLGEVLRELNSLKTRRDLELPSISALLFFHRTAERVDYQELDTLSCLVTKETERASKISLLLSSQFHWYSGIHGTNERQIREQLELSTCLIKKVTAFDEVARTEVQQQAQIFWAWSKISPARVSRQEQEQSRQAVVLLDLAASSIDLSAQDLESLMVRAHFYSTARQYSRALDLLNQAIALQSWIPALLEKSEILISLGDWNQASETIQRVLQQNERSMEALRLNVLILMSQNSDERATMEQLHLMLKSMERYESSNARLFFVTARSLSRLSGRRPVIVSFLSSLCEKAIKLDTCEAAYVVELAHEKAMLGNYGSALETYREAGRSDETNVAALYGTIYSQIMAGDLEDAEQQLDFLVAISESMELSPLLPFLKALLVWRCRGDTNEHIRLLEQAEKIHFQALPQQGSIRIFEKIFRLDPDFLIQLAKEYLLHVNLTVHLTPCGIGTDTQNGALDRGLEILERVSAQAPGLMEPHVLKAQAQYACGNFKAAEGLIYVALRCDSRCAAAYLLASQIALVQGNYRRTKDALDQATSCDFHVRKTPAYALVKANLALSKGDPVEALATLQDAMRLPGVRDGTPIGNLGGAVPISERVAIFVDLAGTLATLSQFAEAANILAEAQERFQGTSEEIRVLMSSCMLEIKRDDFECAIRILNNVPQTSPIFINVQHLKAHLYLSVGHDKRAYLQCYQDLVDLDQNEHFSERLGAAYMRIQAPENAVEAYKQAQNLSSQDGTFAAKIGNALVSTHDYHKATDYYFSALRADTDDTQLRHELATLFLKLRKYGRASQVLAYALEPVGSSLEISKMIQDVRSLLLLTDIYMRSGDEDNQSVSNTLLRAYELQQKIIEKMHSSMEVPEMINEQMKLMVEICCRLARCYIASKAEDEAILKYQEAFKADNANETCIFELARFWAKKREFGKCEEQCTILLRLNAKHDDCAMLLADLLFMKQNHKAATAKFCKILERRPSNYLALSKLIRLLRRAGRLADVAQFIALAEQSDARALSHPGLNFCRGLNCRYSNDSVGAIKYFNLARRDGKWGAPAVISIIELYLNPDNETQWGHDAELEVNSEAAIVANRLFEELRTFVLPYDFDLKLRVLEAYAFLSTRSSRTKIDQAMKVFIDIIEKERDYLPALLGMSTAFMLENSTTKARNALKRIAKMTYSQELADEFERAYLLLADIYIQKSKFDLSEELCSRCLKYNLSCGRAWETMGVIREKEASYKDAADMYEKAWLLEHEASATIGFKLAFNYLKAKRFVEAIDICNKVLSLYPDYPKIRKEILEKAMEALCR